MYNTFLTYVNLQQVTISKKASISPCVVHLQYVSSHIAYIHGYCIFNFGDQKDNMAFTS